MITTNRLIPTLFLWVILVIEGAMLAWIAADTTVDHMTQAPAFNPADQPILTYGD